MKNERRIGAHLDTQKLLDYLDGQADTTSRREVEEHLGRFGDDLPDEVRAQADGPELLLVAWIDECLYVHEIEAFVVSRVEVGSCSDTVVHGRLYGEPLDAARHRLGTVVKAATLHGVSVQAREGRHEVKIIVDV